MSFIINLTFKIFTYSEIQLYAFTKIATAYTFDSNTWRGQIPSCQPLDDALESWRFIIQIEKLKTF